MTDLPLPRPPSVFNAVADASGTTVLTRKRELWAFSHVLEEECAGDLDGAHLFGAFQRPEFYAPARATWTRLAADARSAYVFATFRTPSPGARPVEVPLAAGDPLRQEWAIVVDRPRGPVALAALERPGQSDRPDHERLFDSAWTTSPAVVRRAAVICAVTANAAEAPGAERTAYELSLPLLSTADPVLGEHLLDRLLELIDG